MTCRAAGANDRPQNKFLKLRAKFLVGNDSAAMRQPLGTQGKRATSKNVDANTEKHNLSMSSYSGRFLN